MSKTANWVKIKSLVDRKRPAETSVFPDPNKVTFSLITGYILSCTLFATLLSFSFSRFFDLFLIYALPIRALLSACIIAFLLMIFGEILPRLFVARSPERFILQSMGLILFLAKLATPFSHWIWVLLLRFNKLSLSPVTFIEKNPVLAKDTPENTLLQKTEQDMIRSIFDVSKTVVREIMTPRTDAVCISNTLNAEETIQQIVEHGHSRIPVFEGSIDNIVGIVYAKDFLNVSSSTTSVKKFLREAVFVPETTNIIDLLHQMKKSKFHLAIVVDEYGGMSGLVSLEDIIEEIIGEIQDEYDQEIYTCIEIEPGRFLVDASMKIHDVSKQINAHFSNEDDFDTIGGLVLSAFGKFPSKGEEITVDSYTIKVTDIKKRRLIKLDIQKKPTHDN